MQLSPVHRVATVVSCFQATRPAPCFGVGSGTNLDNVLTKASVEGLICSSAEMKPCDAVNG